MTVTTPNPIEQLSVGDVMRRGVHTAQAETPMRTIAAMMAEHRIHCVVISDLDGVEERAWGVVAEIDLLRAATDEIDRLTAGAVAGTELLTVQPGDALERAVQLMAEHELTHLLVEHDGEPAGVVSALDVARAVAS